MISAIVALLSASGFCLAWGLLRPPTIVTLMGAALEAPLLGPGNDFTGLL